MRYALYFAPPETDPLAERASHWLGRDVYRNVILDQPDVAEFGVGELTELTAEPRRYGFHATLKAPFALRVGHTEQELTESFDGFASTTHAVTIPAITLGQLGPFFALVPAEASPALNDLAQACVRHFEHFRAPLSEADIRRRKPESLTDSQRRNLEIWGYPYVFDDFQFHMTLTGQVPEDRRPPMQTALAAHFSRFIDQPLIISHLSLFVEPEPGAPFVLSRIAPLRPPHKGH